MKRPAAAPCASCPYRLDVPSGVWEREEYEKLPAYDLPTSEQPPAVFLCHQQDGRICAGWAGCHDMDDSLGLRIVAALGKIEPGDLHDTLDYVSAVPLFASGAEAAEHGMADHDEPGVQARRVIARLNRKKEQG